MIKSVIDGYGFARKMPRFKNMPKPTEHEIKLEVAMQQVGFPKVLYFNRFRIDKDDGFTLVQFGLVVASDLVDSYSCILTEEVLQQNQPMLLEYVKKLGSNIAESNPWKGATTSRKADVADIISMSFRGDTAETVFSIFSLCAANQVARSAATGQTTPLPSQPLVLLRSQTVLQKELITNLYG